MNQFVIGVAGPIAAGKNAACAILEKKGFATLDADILVHRIIDENQARILETFLPVAKEKSINLLNPDGKIDRKALGQLLFVDQEALKKQETIVHPEVSRLYEQFMADNPGKPVALNATVLYKTPVISRCQAILYVDAPKLWRFFRIKRRNRLTGAEIFARFRSQSKIFPQYLEKNADTYRVWNIGSLESLEKKIDRFLRRCQEKGYGIWNKNSHYGSSPQ
jgi:dephospho-CoA kinase